MHPATIAPSAPFPLNARRNPALRAAALLLWPGIGLLAPLSASSTAKLAFVTSTTGPGVLGQWPEATGATRLAAADPADQTRRKARHTGTGSVHRISGSAHRYAHPGDGGPDDNASKPLPGSLRCAAH
jgi:hypothetical protein